jgi:hypothetical protein
VEQYQRGQAAVDGVQPGPKVGELRGRDLELIERIVVQQAQPRTRDDQAEELLVPLVGGSLQASRVAALVVATAPKRVDLIGQGMLTSGRSRVGPAPG